MGYIRIERVPRNIHAIRFWGPKNEFIGAGLRENPAHRWTFIPSANYPGEIKDRTIAGIEQVKLEAQETWINWILARYKRTGIN